MKLIKVMLRIRASSMLALFLFLGGACEVGGLFLFVGSPNRRLI